MGVVVFVAAVAVSSIAGSTTALVAAPSVATTTTAPPGIPETTSPLITAEGSTSSDNDHLFTVGDIQVPPGEPDTVSVLGGGQISEDGYVPLVARNNTEETIYEIQIALTGSDANGVEIATADVLIATGGLAPGDWIFGQNATGEPGLAEATNFGLDVNWSTDPATAMFVALDIVAAEFADDAIVGTVLNSSDVVLGNFNLVNLLCFAGPQQPTTYELATADAQRLNPGESATFATTIPIDPATCTSFAAYAVGLPA
jgi:hypothetical protein